MAPSVEKKGPGRPKGSKNKAKSPAPAAIDDGLDDEDGDEGEDDEDGLEGIEDLDEVGGIEDVDEPEDEDLNLPQDYVEDALRSAPKKAVKAEPLPEKKAAKSEPVSDDTAKQIKTLAGQVAALAVVVGALEEKFSSIAEVAANAAANNLYNRLDEKFNGVETLVEKAGEGVSRLRTYLEGALSPEKPAAEKKTKPAPAAAEPEEEEAPTKGPSPEEKKALVSYVTALYRKLQPGKRYMLRTVLDMAKKAKGDVATESRVMSALEDLGIKIVDKKEGYFAVTTEE